MLMSHYRQPIDWTFDQLKYSEIKLDSWQSQFNKITAELSPSEELLEALSNDLNTHLAISIIDRQIDVNTQDTLSQAKADIEFLGIDLERFWDDFREAAGVIVVNEELVVRLVQDRLLARHTKNWKESDRIREELDVMGIAIKDHKDGTTSWEVKR